MPLSPEEMSGQIYNLYPRKVARRAAIRAITSALTRVHDGEVNQKPMTWEDAHKFLLTKTRQYADSPAGNRESFTPYPATFYNQSRYLDHEIEWYRQNSEEKLKSLASIGTFSLVCPPNLTPDEAVQMASRRRPQ